MKNTSKKEIEEASMSNSLVKKLRDAAHPPGKRGLWLKDLPDKNLVEVYQRLLKSQPLVTIAKIAQKEWNILPKSDIECVCKGIRAFRDRVIGALVPDADDPLEEIEEKKSLHKKAAEIVKKVDGLNLMAWAINEQAERLQSWRDKEKASKIPFKSTEATVRELGALLEKYLRLQMELGILDSRPSNYNIQIKDSFNKILGSVRKETIEDMASKFTTLIETSSQTLEQDSEGKYSLIENKKDNDENNSFTKND